MTTITALIADPTRAEMLLAMMDGRAFPASDLAAMAHVSPPTASHHLAKLIEGGLVEAVQQGRHRYHRLANPQVAELIEMLGAVPSPALPSKAGVLTYSRSCYDHLAGKLGVEIRQSLQSRDLIALDGDRYQVTREGERFFEDFGIDSRTSLAKTCIDWTERVPHLGGALGRAVMSRLLAREWIARGEIPRLIVVTPFGEEGLKETFGISGR